MSLHAAVLFLHVLAALVLVGHSVGTPLVLAAIREAPTVGALRTWLRFARDSARLNPPAAMVLLATGIVLAPGRWGQAWLWGAIALWVASTALAVGVVKATGERVGALAGAGADGPLPPELDAARSSARWVLGADALLGTDLAALLLMFTQSGLLGTVLVVAASVAIAVAAGALRRRGAEGWRGAGSPGVTASGPRVSRSSAASSS